MSPTSYSPFSPVPVLLAPSTACDLDDGPNHGHQQGPAEQPSQTAGQDQAEQCGAQYGLPLPVYLTSAPYYCTGASPPHHLYFGGFCPSWSPTQQSYSPTSYCPSLAPTATTPTPPPTTGVRGPQAQQPSYCPSILPPVHPYVAGCCPPPAIIVPPSVEAAQPAQPAPLAATAPSAATAAAAATAPEAAVSTSPTTAVHHSVNTAAADSNKNAAPSAGSAGAAPSGGEAAAGAPPPNPGPGQDAATTRAFIVLDQRGSSADKPPTPPGPSSGYE